MSMDRPEQYPEVSGDESAIVPPQDSPPADWPKPIRMLSANELDRLTIDSAGRFYWDGQLVNYEAMQNNAGFRPVDPVDRNAFEMMDRAALELSDRRQPETMSMTAQPTYGAPEVRPVDLDTYSATPQVPQVQMPQQQAAAVPSTDIVPATHSTLVAPAVRGKPERMRISLSWWQSLGALLTVICLIVGAAGLALHGAVAAHEWGCRIGLVKQFCPVPPAAPVRPEIPA